MMTNVLGCPVRRPDHSSPRCGEASIAIFLIGVALSVLAGMLLKPKSKSPVQDDKPTTLTIRGSYMAWLVGIREVGPVFAWAGDRELRSERSGGGKGTPAPRTDVWYEAGWHQVATGTCDALHTIREGGKIIFKGPITRVSHPSGSTIQLSTNESFTIYWGEPNQPVNTFLGDADRVGISSRWPYCCYVVWNKKRLGSSPNWGLINYEMERRPSNSVLTQSDAWYDPTATLDGPTLTLTGSLSSSLPDVGYLEVAGDYSRDVEPGLPIRLTGNGLPNGDYIVRRATTLLVVTGTNPITGLPIYATRTRIFLETGTLGANSSGTLQLYSFSTDDGVNIAHATAELLYADYPMGLQLDPNGPESWDLESLEALGVEAETDAWRSSLVAVDGEEAKALLAAVMQDHGTLLPFDTTSGNLTFRRCRAPVGTLPNLTTDLEADSLPEVESMHDEKRVDKMVFAFTDRDHSYADMTIAVDDDSQMAYLEYAKAKKIPISTTTNFATAAKLTELRSQEELAGAGVITMKANREARDLIPGDDIVSASFDEVLRVLELAWDPLSETVVLKVTPDFYGARKSDFVNQPGGGTPNTQDAEQDLQFRFVELPEQLLSTEEMFIVTPRIRAHAQIIEAAIHLSRDNISYTPIGVETGVATGGLTDVVMSASGKNYLALGPTFTLRGPDVATAIDLSADPTNFGLGRQVVAIVSLAGVEVCYVQKITAVSGSQYRLDGLLRARYDTRKLAHPVGAEVYVFQDTTFSPFDDILLVPDEDLYMKSQPSTSGGIVALDSIPPASDHLRGKGLVPIDPENPYVSAPHKGSPTYQTGDDVTVKWNWSTSSSSNTGAGFQNAGKPTSAPTIKGAFIVELLTPLDVVVSTQTLTAAQVTYPTAALAAAPISNGNFKVRITHTNNGYSSEPVVLTVTHVT
jgi:hypothetical protein